jgi:hypothetical protein
VDKDAGADDVLVDIWRKPEPFFTISDKFHLTPPALNSLWRVAPDDKRIPVHALASTRKSLIAIFPDAIAIGSPYALGKSIVGLIFIILFSWLPLMQFYFFYDSITKSSPDYMFAFMSLAMGLSVTLFLYWVFRGLCLAMSDWPIVFNRRTRQVTYLPFVEMPFLKFWQWPIRQWRTASWDEVKVRSYKSWRVTVPGTGSEEFYDLLLLWGGEGGDPHALRECVRVGYQATRRDDDLWTLWEHVRRYMEAAGPAIPHGEALRPKTRGKPIVYPADVIEAAGGPPLDVESVAKLAGEAALR